MRVRSLTPCADEPSWSQTIPRAASFWRSQVCGLQCEGLAADRAISRVPDYPGDRGRDPRRIRVGPTDHGRGARDSFIEIKAGYQSRFDLQGDPGRTDHLGAGL